MMIMTDDDVLRAEHRARVRFRAPPNLTLRFPRALWISASLQRDLLSEADRCAPKETGGVLLGYWSASGDAAVVEHIIGPGPNAVHRRTSFEPDAAFHDSEIARLYRAQVGELVYLGDWHTHPNGSAYLSSTDTDTLHRIGVYEAARAPRPVMLVVAGGQPWSLAAWLGEPQRRWWRPRLRIEPMMLIAC